MTQRASQADVYTLDDGVFGLGGLAPKADVPDLWLGARGRTTREVHPYGLLADVPNPPVHLPRPLNGPNLGLHERKAAELIARARHHSTLESPRVRRVPLKQRLREQFI
jgi:hypothetical protein